MQIVSEEISIEELKKMINLRPSWGNKTRGVDDSKIQERIRIIVNKLVMK